MNKDKLFLRIAGVLVLFTFLGHTVGAFLPVPAAQVEVANAVAVMKATLAPMPIGKAQNYLDLFFGNSITVSLFLFVTALGFFFLSGKDGLAGVGRKLLFLLSLGMLGLSVISAFFFFPVPTALTGIAALLGFTVAKNR